MQQTSIVEYVERESAERAMKGLGERMLFGRPVFIREVSESTLAYNVRERVTDSSHRYFFVI